MKLFTALFVVALAGSSAAYSDFTNGITQMVFLDNSSMLMNIDYVYPNVVSSSAQAFDYLISSPSSVPADVYKYITVTRGNYKPWYTAIQANIDNSKAAAKTAVLNAYGTWAKVPGLLDTCINNVTANFAARKCYSFSQYTQNYVTRFTTILNQLSSQISNYQMNVQGAIPQNMLYPLSTALQNVVGTGASTTNPGISMLTLVKQAEAATMQQITDLYSNSVTATTRYTKQYFNNSFSTTIDRINKAISDMIKGAKTAPCM